MKPDDRLDGQLDAQLDARLDAWLAQPGQRDLPAEDEFAAPLAAAARLAPLREAAPSPEFARILEQQLVARADHQRAVQQAHQATRQPSAQVSVATPDDERDNFPVALEARRGPRGQRSRAARTPRALWPLLAASILLALGVGTVTASAHADPSSPLYGLHRTMENAQVQFASSPQQRFQLHVQYANEALSALDAAAHDGDASAYATALSTLQSETAAAKQALAAIPAGSNTDALANQLSDLRTHSRQDLASHLGGLDWANRVATTSAMGTLGAAVPHVGSVTITREDGQGQGTSQQVTTRTDQVVVSGSGFEAGVTLVANGQPVGQVTPITIASAQLVVSVPHGTLDGVHNIGVSNPDGTAAQTSNISVQQDAGNSNNGDNGNTKRPTPTATPGHGHGKHP